MERGEALLEGRGIGRHGLIGLALGLCLLVTLVIMPAAPSIAKKHKSVSLHFKGAQSDTAVLGAGTIPVVARSSRPRKVQLSVSSFQGGPALTTSKRVKLRSGRRTVALTLSTTGRDVLQGCAASRLTVTATSGTGKKGKKSARKPLGRSSSSITQSVPQCGALKDAARCETIASPGTNCLFPWPSDHYTVADSGTPTGLRVNLDIASTPANASGTHIDPADLNRSDGFSPGESIVTRVPGLDNPTAFQKTGAVPLTDMDQAFAPNQPIVLIDASTGQRQLIWSELDSNASSPGDTDLIIRPGRNLIEGHRYIVAMRDLKDSAGNILPAPPGFALYRDGVTTDVPAIESRRAHFNEIFGKLQQAGIPKANLYDAWDFTVASTQNITRRMLSIRDRGLADLGDNTPGDGTMQGTAPSFTVTGTTDFPTATGHGVENIREVTGTYQVPCFLNSPNCAPGGQFNLGSDGLPQANGTMTARFTCNIPRSAVTETSPGVFDVDHQGPAVHVRSWPLRRLHRGAHRQRAPARERRGSAHLRHGLHGHDGGRRRNRHRGAPGPL